MSLIIATGLLCKTYRSGDITVEAIKDAGFTIEAGSFVAFAGPSGSGKSTLLNMVGCLDIPSCGTLEVLDTDVASLNRREAAIFRGDNIGKDTDIDLVYLSEGSRSYRYGFDFARNITTNFEVHGEWAYLSNVTKRVVDNTGTMTTEQQSAR